MQISILAVAAFAAAAFAAPQAYPSAAPSGSNSTLTTITVYTTQEVTITSCAATVTNCPAHSTVVITSTIIDYTTVNLPNLAHVPGE
jgi:hypothetical protein